MIRLQEAEQHTDYALNHTITYQYQVSNVGQDVEAHKGKLEIAQEEGDRVAQQIQSELSESERRMADAQSKMQDKKAEIYSKSARVRSLKTKKIGLRGNYQGETSSHQQGQWKG